MLQDEICKHGFRSNSILVWKINLTHDYRVQVRPPHYTSITALHIF